MDDLIKRDHAAQAIEAYLCSQCDRNGERDCVSCPHLDGDEILKSVQSVNRWISCAARLPEVYEKVLTYDDEGIIHDNFRLNLRDGSVGWSKGYGITHWQPRPEPPERE